MIQERLRDRAPLANNNPVLRDDSDGYLMILAANKIDELETEVEKLRKEQFPYDLFFSAKLQSKAITEWMLRGNRINPLMALFRFGCMRLASRISEIKKNHDVKDKWVTIPKTKKRYKEYWI